MKSHEPAAVLRGGWFKSSFSNKNGCVEVRFDADAVFIRDSKYLRDSVGDPAAQPIITVPAIKWKGFLENIVGNSTTVEVGVPSVRRDEAGGATLSAADGTELVYNPVEWEAFTAGIHAGEFAPA